MHLQQHLEQGDIKLGPWQRIGPFRNIGPDWNWTKNLNSSFNHPFEVERDLLNTQCPILGKTYLAGAFPAVPQAVRQWRTEPDWIDGYLCDLPRGPAPSAGETQYIYREINADTAIDLQLWFRVRAPEESWWPGWDHYWPDRDSTLYRAHYACYLNGKEVQRWIGESNVPEPMTLSLQPDVNHFFAKIGSS